MAMGGDGGSDNANTPFMAWLQNQFVKQDDIDAKIAVLAARMNDQMKSDTYEAVAAAALAGGLAGVGGGCKQCDGVVSSGAAAGAGLFMGGNGTGVTEEVSACTFHLTCSVQGSHGSLKTLKSLEFYFGSLNPGNSLEFCVKTLNPLEICERHKK